MMKFKKFAFAALAGAMAFGMVNASGVQAMAGDPNQASFDADKITVSMVREVGSEEPSFYFFEVLKENKADSKVAASYCLDAKKTTVDVSFIKLSKDAYVRFYTDTATTPSAIVTLKARPKAPKVKYVPGKKTLNESFTLAGTALTAESVKTLEYFDTSTGTWKDFSGLNTTQYVITGVELKIRVKAGEDKDKNKVPASLETKVKIPAAKKAPAVKIDYVKGVINFPKGTEAKVIGADNDGFTYAFTDKATLTPAEFKEKYDAALAKVVGNNETAINASSDYNVFVRTAAIDGKSNPSQWAMVTVKKAPELAAVAEKTNTYGTAENNIVFENKADGMYFTATYATTAKFKFAYSVDAGKKWTAIKAGSAVKVDVKKITSADKSVLIRMNGVKEDTKKSVAGAWPSNSVKLTYAAPITVKSVEVKGTAEITATGEVAYTATVTGSDDKAMENPEVTWSATGTTEKITFDAKTAKLNVTEVPASDTEITIKATCGGKEGTLKVTVKAAGTP